MAKRMRSPLWEDAKQWALPVIGLILVILLVALP